MLIFGRICTQWEAGHIRLLDELTPDEFVPSVYEIDLDKLKRMGKRFILTDLDNTLVPWNHPAAPPQLVDWLQAAQRAGFQVCILSNNNGPRVQAFSAHTGIPAIAKAGKPKPRAFQQAMQQLGARPEQTVMLGDQLFTDVRGGRRIGIYTILVQPIDRREWWGTRFLRLGERLVLRALARRGITPPWR